MSHTEKVIKKFANTPQNVRYADIETILVHLGFEKISTKGSHVKWKHYLLQNDCVIPVHNNECKDFYKIQVYKQIRTLLKKETL